jgi:hypothetical protein
VAHHDVLNNGGFKRMNSDQIPEVGNLEEFKKRMWKTKGARFNAHARLLAKYNCSIFAIAFSSIVVIIIIFLHSYLNLIFKKAISFVLFIFFLVF